MSNENNPETEGRNTSYLPEIRVNKNGYEIRSNILELAVDFAKWEYEMKLKAGTFPTSDYILKLAKEWNNFICSGARNQGK